MDLSEYIFVETFEGRPALCRWFCAESPGSTCLQTMHKSIVFQIVVNDTQSDSIQYLNFAKK